MGQAGSILRARGYCSFYHQGMIICYGNADSRILWNGGTLVLD